MIATIYESKKPVRMTYVKAQAIRTGRSMYNRTPRCTDAAMELYLRIHHQYGTGTRRVMDCGLANLRG